MMRRNALYWHYWLRLPLRPYTCSHQSAATSTGTAFNLPPRPAGFSVSCGQCAQVVCGFSVVSGEFCRRRPAFTGSRRPCKCSKLCAWIKSIFWNARRLQSPSPVNLKMQSHRARANQRGCDLILPNEPSKYLMSAHHFIPQACSQDHHAPGNY
jgi:hypothetical protein